MSKPLQLSRRLVLQGFAGLGITLPALELTHGKAWAQSAPAAAKRFIVFFEHGGYIANCDTDGETFGPTDVNNNVDAWKPASDGEQLVLGPTHQPLLGLEAYLLQLRGIDNLACKVQSDYNGGHGWANVTALTNAKVTQSGESDYSAQGPSIDAVIAARMAQRNPVPFASINLMASAHNYGTPFFRAAGQPVDGETDPRAAFAKLFANVSDGTSPDPAVVRARALKKSVLDGTRDGLALYKNRLSAQDRQTVDAHLELIRGIEQQLDQLPVPTAGCTKPTLVGPFGDDPDGNDTVYNADIPNVGKAHADIIVAAFRCGLTNVATLNMGDFYATWMNPPYPADYNIGHSLDHSANDVGPKGPDHAHFDAWYKTILDNRQFRASVLRRILDGLRNSPEGSGNMLDNSLILWTSEFSYGGIHSVSNLPVMLAGGAGGKLRTGRHLNFNLKAAGNPSTTEYQTQATLNNLFTSCLNLCGYDDTSFGASFSDYHTYQGALVTRAVPGPLPGLT